MVARCALALARADGGALAGVDQADAGVALLGIPAAARVTERPASLSRWHAEQLDPRVAARLVLHDERYADRLAGTVSVAGAGLERALLTEASLQVTALTFGAVGVTCATRHTA